MGDVWTDVSGAGVRVGVFDSAIDTRHPDLAGTTFVPYPDEPAPTSFEDAHGTATAGIIAAAANGTGTVGIAFDAELFSYQSSGSDWVGRYGQTLPSLRDMDVTIAGYTGPASFDPIMRGLWSGYSVHYETAAAEGRDGLGTVFVIGAGNQRGNDTNSGMQYMQAERHSIAVGAVGPDNGYVTNYSSQGSNVFMTAPSGDGTYGEGIWTTDSVGVEGYNTSQADDTSADFTSFSGTSASSPMVVGVVALMLEANPDLGWRDVRDILAITARHTGVAIGESASADNATIYDRADWAVNSAHNLNGGGYHFSEDYGFGLLDARAAVRLAQSWTAGQTSATEVSVSGSITAPAEVPGDNDLSLRKTVTLGTGTIVETVTLFLDLTHGNANNVYVTVISPSGTESTVFAGDAARPNSFGQTTLMQPWTFTSQKFRGEDAAGEWIVEVRNWRDQFVNPGVLNGAILTVYGDAPTEDTSYFYTDEYGTLSGVTQNGIIDDKTGHDTINAAAVADGLTIELRAGFQSTINGQALTIAAGSWIEDAIGGSEADRLTGNAVANHLRGANGNDHLAGRMGDDSLEGGQGADTLVGGFGNDWLSGGDGNDAIRGGDGTDTLIGNSGRDTIQYSASTAGVRVDLANTAPDWRAPSGGHATGDVLEGVENLSGSPFDDRLFGDDGANLLSGGLGNDTLWGRAGDDTLNGGAGQDRLGGGEGVDLVSYSNSSAAVTITLAATNGVQSATGGDATGDTLSGFENIVGTNYDDRLTGDAKANVLIGGLGADMVMGEGGNDRTFGGADADILDGGSGDDTVTGGKGSDRFVFDTAPGAGNIDFITDFNVADDTIRLDDAAFAGLVAGQLAASAFEANLTGIASDALDRIIFETDTGKLYFDADGSGVTARVHLATLTADLELTSTDFFIF